MTPFPCPTWFLDVFNEPIDDDEVGEVVHAEVRFEPINSTPFIPLKKGIGEIIETFDNYED